MDLPRLTAVIPMLVVLLLTGCSAAGDDRVLPYAATSDTPAIKPAAAVTPHPVLAAGAPASAPVVSPSAGPATQSPAGPGRTTPPRAGGPARLDTGPGGSLITTGTAGVALTFDDGPDPVGTPKILALLREYKIKATFCVIGVRVKAYPALVRQIAVEGHTLCNHSWQHLLDLGKRSPVNIRSDLIATQNAIRAAVPDAKIRYFRAPGGNFTVPLVRIAKDLGMTSLYWQVDPSDWNTVRYGTGSTMVSHIIGTVRANTRPGSIVLSHDPRSDTATAYRVLLPWLKARFQLVAMPT